MTDLRIINFHGIGTPGRQLDPGEAPYWVSKNSFRTILDRICEHPARSAIRITFDDSNTSDIEIAAPELARRDLHACFFVLTGRYGRRGSLGHEDVRELQRMGMSIGSHGIDHLDLTTLDAATLQRELSASRTRLAESGAEANGFAIPFGHYNARVLREIRAAGYRAAYTSDGGGAGPGAFVQPRRSVRSDMSADEIGDILAGTMPLRQRVRRAVGMTLKRLT